MLKFLVVVALIVAYVVSLGFVGRGIDKLGSLKSVHTYRINYIRKTLKMGVSLLFILLLFFMLGIEYSQVSVFLSSIFAVIGVALFAQWSILSNITASLIIFFFFPYRVGDRVKVVDKEEEIIGQIEEISLFHVMIRRDDALITYPNNLILQKAVIKNPPASLSNPDETVEDSWQ